MGPIGPGSDLSEKAKLLIETFNRGNVSTDMRKSIIRVLMEKEGISGAQIREHLISATHLGTQFEHDDHQFTEFMKRRWEEQEREERTEQDEWKRRRGTKAMWNLIFIGGLAFILIFSTYLVINHAVDQSSNKSDTVIEETQKSSNEL